MIRQEYDSAEVINIRAVDGYIHISLRRKEQVGQKFIN